MLYSKVVLVSIALAVAMIVLGSPSTASAQECTVKCQCASSGCGCQSSGGNGSACEATGSGCDVTKCDVEETLERAPFAPTGMQLYANIGGANRETVDVVDLSGSLRFTLHQQGEWVIREAGYRQVRTCAGVVLARAVSDVVRSDTERDWPQAITL